MKKQVAVSFEDDLVKVVFASQDKEKTVIQKTLALKDVEFDAFLKTQVLPNLCVIYPFRSFFSETITAPPVKDKHLKTIIALEIKKRFPLLEDFSFFYTVLTDKPKEEKGPQEIFFYAVVNDEINRIVDRFDRHGQTVKSFYPDVLPLSLLAPSSEQTDQKPILCVQASDTGKALFLVKDRQLRFARITASTMRDVQDMDIDNINMTISYCRQQLRLEPGNILLLNCDLKEEDVRGRTVVPVCPLDHQPSLSLPEETYRTFLVPLSAILFRAALKNNNLLPERYRTLFLQRSMARQGTVIFLLLSLIGLGFIALNFADIVSYQQKIARIRQEVAGLESIMGAYDKSSARLQQITPLLQLIQEARSMPDIQKALRDLQFLPMEHVEIQGIQINNQKNLLQMQLSGNIVANGLGGLHRTFQILQDGLGKIPGMTITSKNLDLKNGQFQITIESRIPS